MKMTKKTILLDGNNIIHRTFHANNRSGEPEDVVVGLCIHSALTTMNSYFNTYRADNVVVTFDSYSWRKLYTKDLTKCVTNKKYKGHREENKTPKQLEMRRMLTEHIDELCEILQKHTSILTLRGEYLEGDDLIAAYVQMHRDEDIVVMSGDKDMIQLLRYDHVKLVDPATGNERTLKDWEDNADLFVFEKCIRGEGKGGDNIQSSYPRLYKTKLVKAFHDDYERENIMNHTFTQLEPVGDDYEEIEYRTRDLFEENVILMDLTKQPDKIKARMAKTVIKCKENRGQYNHYKFLGFCGRNELDAIVTNISQFVPMLSVAG